MWAVSWHVDSSNELTNSNSDSIWIENVVELFQFKVSMKQLTKKVFFPSLTLSVGHFVSLYKNPF